MNSLKNAVVVRIKQLCDERGIKPNTLANLSGVTPSTVYSLLDENRNSVQLKTVKILCDGLNITLAEFFDTKEFSELEQEIK